MKKNQEDELMMNEISVKSLEEISGGAFIKRFPILTGLVRPPAGIISLPPITMGLISKPTAGIMSKPMLPVDKTLLK